MTPTEHKDCAAFLRQQSADLGVDVTVSTAPPLVASPYGVTAFACPHGTTYYMEPTGEQIAAWTRDGVR